MASQQPVPIAVVGSGCRFPGGSSSPSKLWELLKTPRDVSKEIPDERFELQGYYHPKGPHHGTTNVTRAYMIDSDVREFDATFFNISPNEADSMDPQQRLLMEVVYEALEAGGQTIEGLRGSDTAVYVGTMSVDYQDMILRDIHSTPTYFSTGVSRAILSNRISYFFDWHGPSMTIDTACSSSMVALHQGVQSLRVGESRVAVAGGTELLLGPEQFVGESKMSLLSPDGKSRMWDDGANGYARGDGIAAVVLKRLPDAIADGDHIECIIRETGVNQDGKTGGITVPSPEAQIALIHQTYAKAGLNLKNPQDWPQFFEAHGTGTKAGDPREARAISGCFGSQMNNGNPLYVGSVKTIIGHTEGTAGLAGVLKASLAIQNGTLPPNMLLTKMNPEVKQYYDNLQVVTSLTPWPETPEGVPRRASVNSFGFGGTNGHAIVEGYIPAPRAIESGEELSAPFNPFLFSAVTSEALVKVLKQYVEYLKANPTVNLRDLASTLSTRRSALAYKAALSATTPETLIEKIEKHVATSKTVAVRSAPAKPRILGVFTGQGAQWPTVGAELIKSSAFVRARLEELDHSLATLPETDRPAWKICEQLSAPKGVSRIGEAIMSQPLCTAIQVVLVDMLRAAGVTFEAVVGHSSGEIGAAYAAGFISGHDAIRIAYYRGFHAKLAKGPSGQKGAMLAVGTSWEDAERLLDTPEFKGRVKIAAQNSAASLTLSGDAEAVADVKRVLDEEKKFARMLVVDTAYHSHHMLPCSDAYVASLRACNIQINQNRDTSCTWFSSVKHGEPMGPVDELKDLYWRDNMVNAVLFADAVKAATNNENLNLAVECGPHPALKGPAQQNISDVRSALPYTGVLARNTNDVEAFADGLGFIWTQLGPDAVNLKGYDNLVAPGPQAKLVVGLPSYPFNNSIHVHESRLAKKMRLRGSPFHDLLGVASPNNTEQNLQWSNFLKISEIPWLEGHSLQGQTVFPAAGYVAMALEAGKKLAGSRSVKVLEVNDLKISKAIAFEEGKNFAVETLTTLTTTGSTRDERPFQEADFAVYSCPNTGASEMDLITSGKVKIVYGQPSFDTLASTPFDDSSLVKVDTERFYDSLAELGYNYAGAFKTMTSMKRRMNQASATVATYNYGDDDVPFVVHPTMLDVAFHAAFLAQTNPGDEQLYSLHVPTLIKTIRVNPELCASLPSSSVDLPVNAILTPGEPASMQSSIDVFGEDGLQAMIQIEDLIMKPFAPAQAADDRPMFATTVYDVAAPNCHVAVGNDRPAKREVEIASLAERLAFYHLRTWQPAENNEASQALQTSLDRLLTTVKSGRHPSIKKEWLNDSAEEVNALAARYPDSVEVKLISAVGKDIATLIQGQASSVTDKLQDGILEEFYGNASGFGRRNVLLARIVKQIMHRFPNTNIIEVGAESSGTVKTVLETIGNKFSSYTFTNASTKTIEKATEQLKTYGPKVACKAFNGEQTPESQGFVEGSYDVVIAASPLRAAISSGQKTLDHIRSLLKPGGYLLLADYSGSVPLRMQALVAGASGQTVNLNEANRTSMVMWHNALRKSGFSGVDAQTPGADGVTWPFSVIVSQAVDDKIEFLRNPLLDKSGFAQIEELVILGSESLETCRIADEISRMAGAFCGKVTVLAGLPTPEDEENISPMSTFINLVDLDSPIFKEFTDEKMEGLKCLFELAKNVLWVTKNSRAEDPYHKASIGFARSAAYEYPHLSMQLLDLENLGHAAPRLITESVLQLAATEEWDTNTILWSREPELYQINDQVMVPRLIPNVDQNARLNSLRRSVTKVVSPVKSTVSISKATDGSMALYEEPTPKAPAAGERSIQVISSALSAMNIGNGFFLYPAIGVDEATGEVVASLTATNASKGISTTSTPINIRPSQAPAFVAAVAAEILATAIVSRLPVNGHLLVHEPGHDSFLTTALARQAAVKSVRLSYSTAALGSAATDSAWIEMNPWTPAHVVKKTIPATVTHFVNLGAVTSEVSAHIKQCLPSGCRSFNPSYLLCNDALSPTGDRSSTIEALDIAVSNAQKATLSQTPSSVIRPSEISDVNVPKTLSSIVDWASESKLTVHVQPIDARNLFSKNATYLLVGLAGTLGQSIAEWMSRNGAGYICLTSRNAKEDKKWQETLAEAGTTVKFLAMDVTKKQDVEKVVAEIESSCPPVAGVLNGAALFRDTLFSEMSMERMEEVMKPKIDGTNNLDEVFGNTALDFFITFSSLTCFIGNSGQTNYTAANAYMSGLMSQRKQRGLAGTSIEFGRIAGIGFMERAGDVARDQLIRFGFMAISETDVHQLLAEGIRAGSPKSGEDAVLTTGCRTVGRDEEIPIAWLHDPRFSHKILEEQAGAGDDKNGGSKKSLPVKDQLAAVTTKEDALEVLKECFALKLAMISNLPVEKVDHKAPITELGIDSLVAVEVRGWFLKELKTDMPVLKVLGGGSVIDLCQQALEKMPETLLPNLGAEKAAAPKGAAAKAAPAPKAPAPKAAPAKPKVAAASTSSSSSGQSPVQTPATQLSAAPSQVNLAEAAKTTPYVKSELISLPQSRFWFLRLLVDDQTTFNVTFYYKITGNLRIGDLERAVRLVCNRHESLRTCFSADEEHSDLAHQNVLPTSLVRLERKKISTLEELDEEYATMRAIPFDLTSGKLIRLILLTRSADEHYLLFNYHHILMDGVSLQVMLTDLEKAYQRRPMGSPPRQLPEYSRYQRTAIENGSLNEQLDFWKNEFPNGHHPVLPLLPMSKVNSRMPMKSFSVNQLGARIGSDLMARIRASSKANKCTPFHFYLATYKAMLFRFTNAEDLTIGIADANRNDTDTMTTIGLLLNLLTLRFQTKGSQTFNECINDARAKAYKALENSSIPFDVLLKELNVPRSSAYSPFFQAFFDYRQGHEEKFTFGNTEFEFLELMPGRTAYDMTLDITDSPDDAHIVFRTQDCVYDRTATQLILDTYIHMLGVFANDSDSPIEKASLFSQESLQKSIGVGRGWDLKSTWPETLPRRIDQVAADNQDKLAIKDGNGTLLTYAAMTKRTEAVAEALQKAGIGHGDRVLVFEDATVDWPCSMLAIMRVGAVYVPLDLRNPLARLADVAISCEPKAILIDDTTAKDAPEVNVTNAAIINVSNVAWTPAAPVANISRGSDVAAILFSSGSTGKPKGIVVKHSGLRNEIEGYTTQWGLKAETTLQQSAFTFNHSSDQIYTGLTNGGTVVMVPWSKRGDPIEVSKMIAEEGITYTKATPAEYGMWLDYGRANLDEASAWRFAFGGGESLTASFVKSLAKLDLPLLRFFNSYGPTEISISSTKMEIEYREEPGDGRIPCGFSLPNYAAYILDAERKPLPVGMPGELWIGGAGVSLGYLNNKELTDQHFFPDPYATPEYVAQGWTMMYRTGDIAHMQQDGAMVFHSRIAGDTQVKLRGLRIELGDIESNIVQASNGKLKEAAVTLRDGDPQLLVAHVVFAQNHGVADTEAYLQRLLNGIQLPQYMIPAMAIPLDRMPLSKHSKVDRKVLKSLPLPTRVEKETNEVDESLTPTMTKLKQLWEKTLGAEELNLSIKKATSFFTIGGNSLLIVRLQSAIRGKFDTTVRLVDLLGANTLGEMAQLIDDNTNVEAINWDQETQLPDTTVTGTVTSQPLKTENKTVLVTGAGGFLGKHVLAQLIASPEISKIHVIGLREKIAGKPRELAVSSDKIVKHAGDLTEPWLGLSEAQFWEFASQVDSILHMGALRPFYDSYHSLRPSNVDTTKQLIRLAAARQIPINYVSTAGVIPKTSVGAAAVSYANSPPATDGSDGYNATRWASEQVLDRAASNLGVPVNIHRFVESDKPDSAMLTPALDHFVDFVDRLSLMPDCSATEGHFEMMPVDQASSALASSLVANPTGETKGPVFHHHQCHVNVDVAHMNKYMQERRGDKKHKTSPVINFIGHMKRNGLQYFVTSHTLLMGQPGGAKVYSRR